MTPKKQLPSSRITVASAAIAALILGVASLYSGAQSAKLPADRGMHIADDYGKLPLSFEANQGQADASVEFLSHGDGYSLFLTDTGAVLALGKPPDCDAKVTPIASKPAPCSAGGRASRDIVRMTLGAANLGTAGRRRSPTATGEDQLPGKVNYFIGKDPAKWRTNLPTYAKVRYAQVYNGVDLVYYGNQRQLEYDFIVAPGASPERIRIGISGGSLKLDRSGNLTVRARNGELAFHKPAIYQEIGGHRVAVMGRFALLDSSTVGFRLGGYDRSRPLVIDPLLSYSTYFGSLFATYGSSIAVDAEGNAYITGTSGGTSVGYIGTIPTTPGVFQPSSNAGQYGGNAFISKMNPEGTALVYSTYLGGSGSVPTGTNPPVDGDGGTGIAVDSAGNAYVTGYTFSYNFPNVNSYQGSNNGQIYGNDNAFVAKINPTGTALLYSTYLGGSGCGNSTGDSGSGIAVDTSFNAYVAGTTCSPDFPVTVGAFQTAPNWAYFTSSNAFVTKFDPTGENVVYSTYLGGGGQETGNGIAVDGDGSAYVTGTTYSQKFPVTAGAFQLVNNSANGGNAFVTKFNSTGTALTYSTYLGGNNGPYTNHYGTTSIVPDSGNAIAVDSDGNAYVTGVAGSTNFPVTSGAFQTANNANPGFANAFVTKLNSTGTALLFSTYLGGSGGSVFGDSGAGIAVGPYGSVWVTGSTGSANFPLTPGAFQTVNNGVSVKDTNAFVTELNSTGAALLYSTYLGGTSVFLSSMSDFGAGIAVDWKGNAYVTGTSESYNFPTTPGAFETSSYAGAFISSFAPGPTLTVTLHSDWKVYGAPINSFLDQPSSYTISGLMGSDTVNVTPSTSATSTSPAGSYPITATVSGPAAVNYKINVIDSTFEVYKAPLHVEASNAGVVYGNTPAQPTAYFFSGFVNGDTASAVSGAPLLSTSVTSSTPVGTYLIDVQPGTLSAANYYFDLFGSGEGSVWVYKAVLNLTADNLNMTQGSAVPSLTYQLTGFVNGDSAASAVTGSPVLSTTVTSSSPPGKYPITITPGSLAAHNYEFKPVMGVITVLP